ncbi:hypothetical protein XI03_35950 [Bradyrhizobium sp. CCBAU 65884]|uniref:hypothetical protein n=1 Tax=Bradyrhizobium sp. CCBAU 65884 TaxID=722477 RepID=UPI0023066F1A|nr:hypothetical protein [Bradyrhizobium sp. CCBAU 65884]MDA9479798.1 hypothetical protein [Bradyrhizobium sp. CCBAU 65884]
MSIRKIILLNAMLVSSVGVFGVLIDEPYWRAVGHAPWLYDYFFWLALALNGPSGFVADYAAWLAIDSFHLHRQVRVLAEHEWQFAIQYALWLLFLWPQWKAYDTLVRWCRGHPDRETALRLTALGIALVGCVWAYQSWEPSHRVGLFFIDRFFWVVRPIGLGLSGIVVLLYDHLAQVRFSQVKQT